MGAAALPRQLAFVVLHPDTPLPSEDEVDEFFCPGFWKGHDFRSWGSNYYFDWDSPGDWYQLDLEKLDAAHALHGGKTVSLATNVAREVEGELSLGRGADVERQIESTQRETEASIGLHAWVVAIARLGPCGDCSGLAPLRYGMLHEGAPGPTTPCLAVDVEVLNRETRIPRLRARRDEAPDASVLDRHVSVGPGVYARIERKPLAMRLPKPNAHELQSIGGAVDDEFVIRLELAVERLNSGKVIKLECPHEWAHGDRSEYERIPERPTVITSMSGEG